MRLPAAFLQPKYVIKYAFMPNKPTPIHPWIAQLPAALRARMDANGHTQKDVESVTGVPQPQISRALNGHRKRPTEAMRKLCKYAELDTEANGTPSMAELAGLLQRVVAGGPAATECAKGVLESLALLLGNSAKRKLKT